MPIADKSVTGAANKILGLLNPEPETPKESTQGSRTNRTRV
jgi:hypothetical protein